MIEVNNFNIIQPLLHFEPNYKSIILVWLVSRKKDGHTQLRGSNRVRTLKSYHFASLEQFLEKKEEIILLCKTFYCRAYICIQPKSLWNILFNIQDHAIQGIIHYNSNETISLKGCIDSAVMKSTAIKGYKYWVIDVDNGNQKREEIYKVIRTSKSKFADPIITYIPTVHGYHIITHAFDPRELEKFNDLEIKKTGLTLLYAYLNV